LLFSSWHGYPCCNCVAIISAQASLRSRRLCHCCVNIVALIAMALLPASSWCCCSCHDGIVTIINAQASLSLSQWCHCPCCASAIPNIVRPLMPLLHRRCCPYHADLFALTLHGRCHRHCSGVVAPVMLACLRHCTRVVTLFALALLPFVHWH
jgi:hypothetical protein